MYSDGHFRLRDAGCWSTNELMNTCLVKLSKIVSMPKQVLLSDQLIDFNWFRFGLAYNRALLAAKIWLPVSRRIVLTETDLIKIDGISEIIELLKAKLIKMIAINPEDDPEPHPWFPAGGHRPSETSNASSKIFEFWSLNQRVINLQMILKCFTFSTHFVV